MVRKLEAAGLPRTEAGYPWPEIRDWYRQYEADRPAELSQKEAAKRLGVSTRQLRNLEAEGVPRTADGEYPWPEIRDWYVVFKQQEAVDRAVGGTQKAADFYEARARKESALADLREMEVLQKRGELIHIDDLEELVSEPLSKYRSRILGLPGLVAPRLARREMEIAEIVAILEAEIHAFLEPIASEGVPIDLRED